MIGLPDEVYTDPDVVAAALDALHRALPPGMKAVGGVGNGVFEISEDLVGLEYLWAHPELFAVLIPVQIYNFIETMNNVESAEAAGDKYPVGVCQVNCGRRSMFQIHEVQLASFA